MKLNDALSRLTRTAFAITIGTLSVNSLHAQGMTVKPAASAVAAPVSLPQYSSITSSNDTIQVSRMPVTYNGTTYYADISMSLQFGVSSDGAVTFNVVPTVVESPQLTVSNFKAGTYIGPADVNGDKSIIVVSGPSPLAGGGTGWTLTTTSASSPATYPSTAVWYVESIANNPLAARLEAAKITSTAYSYGEGDSGSDPNYEWPNNALLGFTQVGNTLSISSFTYTNFGNIDTNTPVDTITYTLQQ